MFTNFASFLETQRAESPQPLEACPYTPTITETAPDREMANFLFEADPCLYDSGKRFAIAYQYNKDEPNCLENRMLDDQMKDGDVLNEFLDENPDFHKTPFYDTATLITIKTIDGKLTWTIAEHLDAIVSYPQIPSYLSHIPTVPIAELRHSRLLDMYVDRVKWDGATYAFKRIGEDQNGTLSELEILTRLANSPNIINVVAIVINQDNTMRGFLTPFISTGDLLSVFKTARQSIGLDDDDDATAFDWPLKLSWAQQITQGVVELHAIGANNGDLKPRNVLIDSTGRAVLIDFLSTGITAEFSAPEILDRASQNLEVVFTSSADVYSLGLLLFEVAEERCMRTLVWRDGKTPDWYRDIVDRCLVLAPEVRPSAAEVLYLLEREGE